MKTKITDLALFIVQICTWNVLKKSCPKANIIVIIFGLDENSLFRGRKIILNKKWHVKIGFNAIS